MGGWTNAQFPESLLSPGWQKDQRGEIKAIENRTLTNWATLNKKFNQINYRFTLLLGCFCYYC